MKTTILSVILPCLCLAGCASMGEQTALARPGEGMGGPDLSEMAMDACAVHARPHGRAMIGNVQALGADLLRVTGVVDAHDSFERRAFTCSYHADGRVIAFDIG